MINTIDVAYELQLAFEGLRALRAKPSITGDQRHDVLESMAAALEDGRKGIISTAAAETALTGAELEPEFDRMIGTLRMFSRVVREGAWKRAAAAAPAVAPERPIGPNHDLRTMLVPLGPVAVFGASNFPLAYGVCGGDTASALAAGCPVIVKEHPAHIKTGRLILRMARHGIRKAGADESLLGYAASVDPADMTTARDLVSNPLIKAVGFTGSQRGGLAIEDLARARPNRIPVFAEMGSANPVIITPMAARTRGREIGEQIGDSILARFGQQCTCPGIICVPDAAGAGRAVVDALAARVAAAAPRDMLAPWIRDGYVRRVRECLALPEVRLLAGTAEMVSGRGAHAALLMTTSERFAWNGELREEIFGPAAVIVDTQASDPAAWADLAVLPLPASLTLSVFFEPGEPDDVQLAGRIARTLEPLAGRIVFNGVPTGVRVAEAMVHGGPFPASNRPDTSAVGPRAIERWCRPVCWQNRPQGLGEGGPT